MQRQFRSSDALPLSSYARLFVVKMRSLALSLPRRLLFEHVPKCGGSTVVHYLAKQYPRCQCYLIGADQAGDIARFQALPESERFAYGFVAGHGAHRLRHHVHPDTVKATVLRDPVDRVISHYYYVMRSPDHYLYEAVADAGLGLDEYVRSGMSAELHNHYVTSFLEIEESEAWQDCDGAVSLAYDLIRAEYDVVGVLDELQAAVNEIGRRVGFLRQFRIRNRNVTENRPKVGAVAPETLATIRRINAMAVALFTRIREDAPSGDQ